MIKRNLSAALIAAGMLAIASTSQAIVVDLVHNNSGIVTNSYGSAFFEFTNTQSTGTAVIDPFLRVEATGTERAYNTSGGTLVDDKAGPFTHDVKVSALQSPALDVNEPNGTKSNISLDTLKSYASPIGNQATTNVASLGTVRYDLDAGGDNQALFDTARNTGTGSADAFFYIPASAFAGTSANDYLYMYVEMGDSDETAAGGFEEISMVQNPAPVPEMSALFPIFGLLVAVGSTHILRRRRMARTNS